MHDAAISGPSADDRPMVDAATSGIEIAMSSKLEIAASSGSPRGEARIACDREALRRVDSNRSALESALAEGQPIYGVTTGLGALVTRQVAVDETGAAQAALLRSHASGTGPDLPREVVRAAMAVRVAASSVLGLGSDPRSSSGSSSC